MGEVLGEGKRMTSALARFSRESALDIEERSAGKMACEVLRSPERRVVERPPAIHEDVVHPANLTPTLGPRVR
jgi:hypothetical protein